MAIHNLSNTVWISKVPVVKEELYLPGFIRNGILDNVYNTSYSSVWYRKKQYIILEILQLTYYPKEFGTKSDTYPFLVSVPVNVVNATRINRWWPSNHTVHLITKVYKGKLSEVKHEEACIEKDREMKKPGSCAQSNLSSSPTTSHKHQPGQSFRDQINEDT